MYHARQRISRSRARISLLLVVPLEPNVSPPIISLILPFANSYLQYIILYVPTYTFESDGLRAHQYMIYMYSYDIALLPALNRNIIQLLLLLLITVIIILYILYNTFTGRAYLRAHRRYIYIICVYLEQYART